LGQISESREGKLDIEFVSGGRKTILKSTELKPAASSSQDFKLSTVRLSEQFCRRCNAHRLQNYYTPFRC
jgi:hypothetical protein